MTTINTILDHLKNGNDLTSAMGKQVFGSLLTGGLEPAQAGALLLGLSMKGETAEELGEAVNMALEQARIIPDLTEKRIDTCGTGGDGKNSFNCSTAVSLFLADMGYKVVKHGNKGVSSKCGSADIVKALGFPFVGSPEDAHAELAKRNFVFLFAPQFHPAFKHVAPIRQALGIRTLFNLVGPLINPALPTHQLMGVPAPGFAPLMATVLAKRGIKAAVVHGAGGFDELTPCGVCHVIMVADGKTTTSEFDPQPLGFERCVPEAMQCRGPEDALEKQKLILAGTGPKAMQDMVALNLGMAIHILEEGVTMAEAMQQARTKVKEGVSEVLSHAS
ncbi:anthranilate phosphoribosyltransferase [Desulfoplanes sp.]